MTTNSVHIGRHEDFEQSAVVDVRGRRVEDLVASLKTLSELVADVDHAFVEDIHLYNHDQTGAHLSLNYSQEDAVRDADAQERVTLVSSSAAGSPEVYLRVWKFSNVTSPADASTALKTVMNQLQDYLDEHFLDLASSCAVADGSVFSLELRLYTSQ